MRPFLVGAPHLHKALPEFDGAVATNLFGGMSLQKQKCGMLLTRNAGFFLDHIDCAAGLFRLFFSM